MATHKRINAICIGITVFTLLLTILFMNGKALGIQAVASEENSDAMFTTNDLDAAWDTAGATKITLSDEGSTVSGNGAYVYDGDIHIVYAGKYMLSGKLTNGSVIIEADGDDKIWLMLDGAAIHCEDNAAIRVEQAGKVFMTLQDGTENAMSSGSAYSEETVSAGVDGTIYSRDDLTINGAGSLQVTAQYQHGIVCNDDFVVTGGTLNVTATRDAIHANDSARIKDANISLSAGDDGITVSNDEETSFLYVESGNITIPSCYEGLEAVQITIAGGKLDISATDDGLNANGYGGSSVINITGGEITVTVENGRDADGIDSNKDIYISGGKLFISVSDNGGSCAIDYGSENGGKCEISGGTVLACGSSGMAEGFDSTSTQGFLMQTTSASAGTTVTVKDADGNELLSEKVPCSFSSVLVSTPEMNVGDTCKLIVGDTETEMTIDNASSGGGFGGFGGKGMSGENGFGGGQMPDRGDFGRNGEAFDGGSADETQDSESTQKNSKLSVTTVTPAVSLLSTAGTENQDGNAADNNAPSETQNGNTPTSSPGNGEARDMQPPEMPNDADRNMTTPDLPQNGAEGDIPSDLPQENMPDSSQNGDSSNGAQPGFPQGGGNFGERPNGGNMQNPNGNIEEQENAAQPANTGTPISSEQFLLLGISSAVLLCGCMIAFLYKRRG